jgi:acyl carrier protein
MSEALKTQIKEIIIRELDLRQRSVEDIDDDAPLFGDGLGLDSLDALQLAMALEEHFGVAIPEGEEARQIFASVSAISAHIAAERK